MAKQWVKNHKKLIAILAVSAIITSLFFLVPIAVFPDSLTYYNYLKIFHGIDPISSWVLLRGPSFPTLIFIFTSIFCSAMVGLLILMYTFFVGLLTLIYSTLNKFIDQLKLSKRMRYLAIFSFLFLIVFNSVLFGYFHALLTEFIATFFAFVSCFMAWKWLGVDFFKSRTKYILFNLGFAFIFIFMWFLKQPYLTIALFPLSVACVISICKGCNLKNIIQRIGTLIICIACLVLAIIGWRGFLSTNGVDYKTAGSVDSSYLSSGIIDGLSNVRQIINDDVDVEKVRDDRFFTADEKSQIIQIRTEQSSGGHRRVQILNIMNPSGKIIDKLPIFQESEVFSTSEAVLTWLKIATKHPIVVIDSYISNYLAIVDIFGYTGDAHVGVLFPIKKFSVHGHENHSIGLLYTYYPANMDVWTKNSFSYPGLKYIKTDINPAISKIMQYYGILHCGIYIVLFLLLPLALIYAVVVYRKLLRKKSDDKVKKHIYELILIILGFTFLHIMFQDVMGAIIDRYSYVAFPGVALCYILLVITNEKFKSIIENFRFNKLRNR